MSFDRIHLRVSITSLATRTSVRLRLPAAPLERDRVRWSEDAGSRWRGILVQDAGWGVEASAHAETLFTGFAEPGGSVGGGRSCRVTARIFSVSVATVVRWSQRFRTTGSAGALAMGGPRLLTLAEGRAVQTGLSQSFSASDS